jgi:hypothetical protein
VIPVTVSFTPTSAEWQEALRACRMDQWNNRAATAFFIVLIYTIIRVICLIWIPVGDGEIFLGYVVAILFLLYFRMQQHRRRGSVVKRQSPETPTPANADSKASARGEVAVPREDPSSGGASAQTAVPTSNPPQTFSRKDQKISWQNMPRTLLFKPESVEFRSGGKSSIFAWSSFCYSETRHLFVAYLLDNAFPLLPRRVRGFLPAFVLMCSRHIQLLPIPKRSFGCLPDQNNVRDLLYAQSRSA